MPKIAQASGGWKLDQRGLRRAFSNETASTFDTGGRGEKIEGFLPNGDGSMVRIARLERSGPNGEDCGRYTVSDRLSVSVELNNVTDATGHLKIEIRARHSNATRRVFSGLFSLVERGPEWLVTVAGQPAEEWEIHLGFESNSPSQSAQAVLSVICDRAGLSFSGREEPSIQLAESLLFQQVFPAPSATNAGIVTVANVAYPGPAQVTMADPPDEAAFANLDAAAVVWLSWDGATDHVKLDPATPTAAITFPTHQESFWLRLDVAGSADVQYIVSRVRPV